MQRIDRARRRLLDRVVDRKQSGEATVHGKVDDAGAFPAQSFGVGRERGRIAPCLAQQRGIAKDDGATLDNATHADAGGGLEGFSLR